MTVAIYIRVSTVEQATEGYSIAAQKERLLSYCKAQGWDNYKFYIDEGISAKDTNRPELKRLFEDMRNGRINMILVYRLDRFTRRVVDFHRMLEEMNKYNCTFKSATEAYDTSNAMGRMFISLVATIAQWETENLSERIKMALDEKVSSGEWVGGVPFWAELDENEKLVRNEKAEIVLDMIEKVFDGWSMNKIKTYLNNTNRDKETWHVSTIQRLLQNPALYGAKRWNNKIYENNHEGIISKDKYDKLQSILKDRGIVHVRDSDTDYIFQGVLKCPGCGNTLSSRRDFRKKKDGTLRPAVSYRCQFGCGKSFGELRMLDALYNYMKEIELPKVEPPKQEKENNYDKQLKQIKKTREKYQRAWANDFMTEEEFANLMNETRELYEDLKDKANKQKEREGVSLERIKNIIFTFNENFAALTNKEKKEFVSRFIRSIEFSTVDQPPKNPDVSKKGKEIIVFDKVVFM